jgi:hypothetical protein
VVPIAALVEDMFSNQHIINSVPFQQQLLIIYYTIFVIFLYVTHNFLLQVDMCGIVDLTLYINFINLQTLYIYMKQKL